MNLRVRSWHARPGSEGVAEAVSASTAPLAAPGRAQALAAPLLDLDHRPHFRPKAARVLDLYSRTWQGRTLGEDEYVISADEKTSIQGRWRCHLSQMR